jgi:galactosylceramidase
MFAALALLSSAAGFSLKKAGGLDKTFDGLGGLSGGGATTRLLVDYPEDQKEEILDVLFKPNYGASLQILKVEIGGDSQSTDGTESSHMHDNATIDLNTGYEWWLMTEAKKRNPNIKLYGLPWAFPGWVGNDPQTGEPSGSPFAYPEQTSRYIMEWLKGAKTQYGLDIDFIGIWNERDSDATYAESLRTTLDNAGFSKTQIVAKDGGADICDSMKKDPAYAKTVDIIGLHYPSDFEDLKTCHSFGKPVWASEESSSYDDLNGAACWARVVNSHYVLAGITSSIMWNLVGAYYHGTNWYASSMLTSVQPWSGHFETLPVVWATAHVTQFTEIGWQYLKNGFGSGELAKGGYYTTIADGKGSDWTLQVVKISYDHAPCTRPKLPPSLEGVEPETAVFTLDMSMGAVTKLACWKSNFEAETAVLFEQQADIAVVNGQFSLDVAIGDFYTVSTVRTATRGAFAASPASVPQFPLPHSDDFNGYATSQEARYFADQIGAWEIHPSPTAANASNLALKQMVPQLPIGWSDHGSNGPMTLIGMREWQDVSVAARVKLPAGRTDAAGCVATRVEQMWRDGIVLCVGGNGVWNLTVGGPPQNGQDWPAPIATGKLAAPVTLGVFHSIALATNGDEAEGSWDGATLFSAVAIRTLDTGFAALGTNLWLAIEFDDVEIKQVGCSFLLFVFLKKILANTQWILSRASRSARTGRPSHRSRRDATSPRRRGRSSTRVRARPTESPPRTSRSSCSPTGSSATWGRSSAPPPRPRRTAPR